jgi:hypothetical protein
VLSTSSTDPLQALSQCVHNMMSTDFLTTG